ncbi:MAG: ATP-binding cassette domain-containing protein, partial [Chloroflexota bacterium]
MNPTDAPLIETRDLKRHFTLRPGALARWLARAQNIVVSAVDGVSLKIEQGETVGLVGESGCGKTTLGRLISRLDTPTAGDIFFKGHSLREGWFISDKSTPIERLGFYRVAQVIFQNPYSSLNPRKTIREIIATPLINRGLKDVGAREETIVALLRRVGLHPRNLEQYPHQFSGGQRQRIGIARA